MIGRGLGQPALFATAYMLPAAGIYFALGVITDRALGLTPLIFLLAGVAFALAAMTYTEGASMHPERAGSTVFARYAFNELVSFIAGWAILLDYVILVAVTALSATSYLAAFWEPLGDGAVEVVAAIAIIAAVAARNIAGFPLRVRLAVTVVMADIVLQALLVGVGLLTFFDWRTLTEPIDLGSSPQWEDAAFALGVSTVVFIGLESASSLSGEVRAGRRALRRLISSVTGVVVALYVGTALLAVTALPVRGGESPLGDSGNVVAPVLAITRAFPDRWLADAFTYLIAVAAALTLVAASNSAMMGLGRLSYSLSRNLQIPAALGRLHARRSTPFVLIGIAAVLAAALVVPRDQELLVGLYALGALLGLTIAHASIIVLRAREPDRRRNYRVPFSVRIGGRDVPLPAVAGAVLSAGALASVVLTHGGSRWVGLGWMAFGVGLYVVYRLGQGMPLTKRVLLPEEALRFPEREEMEFGSILVPLTGTPLDDDIVQTAGRLAGEERDEGLIDQGATIEVIWVFEVPLALPIDAQLPAELLERARAALRRAKAVGEEYEGVTVQTATVRARRAGAAIVEEARRRGVQAIVMAAEEPSRIRGGALLGGRGGPLDNYVGETTKYVVSKAPCEVILTVPPAEEPAKAAVAGDGAAGPDAAGAGDGPVR